MNVIELLKGIILWAAGGLFMAYCIATAYDSLFNDNKSEDEGTK